jgi:diguanylate cyclase (GGDEF)-like protein
MALMLLPNVLALVVFLGAFRPLARRGGPLANAWFFSWAFVILHVIAMMAGGSDNHLLAVRLVSLWSVECAGLAFLRAAKQSPVEWVSITFQLEVLLPVLMLGGLFAMHAGTGWTRAGCSLLLTLPLLHLALIPRFRDKLRLKVAWAAAGAGVLLAPVAWFNPMLNLSLLQGFLFAGAACVCLLSTEPRSRGGLTTVVGLTLYGLTFPLGYVLNEHGLFGMTTATLTMLPLYLVAYGNILMLIERYVVVTENEALHDPLTGLPNLRLFEDRLEQAVQSARHADAFVACLMIDVDDFKNINDTLGHRAGDELLQALTTRLGWYIGPGDTLARTGGDEFAAVLTRLHDVEGVRFMAGGMLSATCVPVIADEHTVPLRLSIGIAISPPRPLNAKEFRHRADVAMYAAKRAGGNRFTFEECSEGALMPPLPGVQFVPAVQPLAIEQDLGDTRQSQPAI